MNIFKSFKGKASILVLLVSSIFLVSCSEDDSKPCESNPCKDSPVANKTICEEKGTSDFICACENGYEDDNGACKAIEVDPCNPNPCTGDNQIDCTATGVYINDYICSCDSGYHFDDDKNCVKTVNPCEPNLCEEENKNVCIVVTQTAGDFSCECNSGYELKEGVCTKREMSEGCFLPMYKTIIDNDLRDMALINKLHEITGLNYNSIGYTSARSSLYNNVDNINGRNRCVYTGNWHSPGNGVNCEHTWPQSKGASGTAKSDMHHLFPTENDVNSSRGNLPFGNVSGDALDYYGQCNQGSATYYCSKRGIASYVTTVFEPADQHKGDVARAMFYFATRYGNKEYFIDRDMKIDLLKWHKEDPVVEREITRNNRIQAIQNNRNPYSDCPEFLDRIDFNKVSFPERF